jgi:hypothetical protein
VDRPSARADWVLNQTFDLFDRLGATEEQLDFPVIYASALHGWASREADARGVDMTPLFETIVERVPPPAVDIDGPFQQRLHVELELGEIEEGCVGLRFDEQIDVARRGLLAPGHRTEGRHRADAVGTRESLDQGLAAVEGFEHAFWLSPVARARRVARAPDDRLQGGVREEHCFRPSMRADDDRRCRRPASAELAQQPREPGTGLGHGYDRGAADVVETG